MKKITILALHLNYGGIEKYISYLCKMFENDYRLEIIVTYKYADKPAFAFSDKVDIKYLTNDFPDRVSIKKLLHKCAVFEIAKEMVRRIKLKSLAFRQNKKTIKNLETDYIITTRIYHNKIVNKYFKGKNTIKIATEHNYHNNNEKYTKDVVNSTTNFDYFIHCTDELYNYYKPIIKGPKNVRIYNPVYIPNNCKSNLDSYNIISVGRLSDEKGFVDLIEVMKNLNEINPKVRLTICGDGYQRAEIEKMLKVYDLEKKVTLTGFVEGKKLAEAFKNASLYVLPSKSEAFGLVLLEAMHYGLPCIAFDSASGARNLLKNDVGILVKNRDISEMAKKINELLIDKKKLKEYSIKSIKCVGEYSLEKIYEHWKKILK